MFIVYRPGQFLSGAGISQRSSKSLGRHSGTTWERILKDSWELCKPWPKFSEVLDVCADTDIQSLFLCLCVCGPRLLACSDRIDKVKCYVILIYLPGFWSELIYVCLGTCRVHKHTSLHPCIYRLWHMNFIDCKFSNYLHIFESFISSSL